MDLKSVSHRNAYHKLYTEFVCKIHTFTALNWLSGRWYLSLNFQQ